MTEVLAPSMASPPPNDTSAPTEPQRRPDPPSHTPVPPSEPLESSPEPQSGSRHDRTTSTSTTASLGSTSRPPTIYSPSQSSLSYTLVRDFAYPAYHPMFHGPLPDSPSSVGGGEAWDSNRRSSDSAEGSSSSGMRYAGPWGGDGPGVVYYRDPEEGKEYDELPATAYGREGEDDEGMGVGGVYGRSSAHRKSRSYANIEDFGGERGRRRAGSYRKTDRASQLPDTHTGTRNPTNAEQSRRDSPLTHSRPLNPDSDLPLDHSPHTHTSPQRSSLGPDDEDLYHGESLALYGFEPENSNELRLVEGQVVIVSYRHEQGWLVASDPVTGEQGLIPEAYVKLVREIGNWDPVKGGWVDEDDEEAGEIDDTEEVHEEKEDDTEEKHGARSEGRERVEEEKTEAREPQ